MKKVIIFAALMLFSSQLVAMPGVTKGGHVACQKKEWLDDMIKFVVAEDMASFKAYVDSGKCLVLKAGLRVTVTDPPGIFGGTAGFTFQGIKFWTVREGLEYNP